MPLAIALVFICVGSAVLTSTRRESTYAATASYELTHGVGRPDLTAHLQAEQSEIASQLEEPGATTITARPGNPRVRVTAHSDNATDAVNLANYYTAELVARDRGINREEIARRIAELQAEIDAATPGSRRAARLGERVAETRTQQVTDANFQPIRTATRVDGPEPVENGLVALPVGVVVAAVTLLALHALDQRRRRPANPGPMS